jgi:integrase
VAVWRQKQFDYKSTLSMMGSAIFLYGVRRTAYGATKSQGHKTQRHKQKVKRKRSLGFALKKLMGHSDIETTMIYSHLADEHVDKAVEKLIF